MNYSSAVSPSDMKYKSSVILSCSIIVCVSAVPRAQYEYNYEEYEYHEKDWSQYDYQWSNQQDQVDQRGETSWRSVCRDWSAEEIYLQGDKVKHGGEVLLLIG